MTRAWGTWAAENGGRSGTGFRDGIWHALGEPYPEAGSASRPPSSAAPADGPAGTAARWTLCGLVADVVRKAGVFDPTRFDACPACGWWEAIRTDTIPDRLSHLATKPRRALAVALAEAILADARKDEDGIDAPGTVELLAALTAHAGTALITEECAEGECDHPDRDENDGCPTAAVACPTCSVRVGSWAGEWEGRYRPEATVMTPCSVLTAMAAHYEIGAGLFDRAQLADSLMTAGGAS